MAANFYISVFFTKFIMNLQILILLSLAAEWDLYKEIKESCPGISIIVFCLLA